MSMWSTRMINYPGVVQAKRVSEPHEADTAFLSLAPPGTTIYLPEAQWPHEHCFEAMQQHIPHPCNCGDLHAQRSDACS